MCDLYHGQWRPSSNGHVCSGDDPKHSQIDVDFYSRLPPSSQETTRKYVGRRKRTETGTHAATATVAAVRCPLAKAVCTVAATATMFSTMLCSQVGQKRAYDYGRTEGRKVYVPY